MNMKKMTLKALQNAADMHVQILMVFIILAIGGVSYGARGAKPPPQILQRRPENEG